MSHDQLIETWQIHNRINLYLLDGIEESALDGKAQHGGRSVKGTFAHLHNVRLMWIKSALPEEMESINKIAMRTKSEKAKITKARLADCFEASGVAIEKLLRHGLETGKISGFKPHPSAFLGYMISHESYHRGEIDTILIQAGTPLNAKVASGLWEWSAR